MMNTTMNAATLARTRLDAEIKKQALRTARQQKKDADKALKAARKNAYDAVVEIVRNDGEVTLTALSAQTGLNLSDIVAHVNYKRGCDEFIKYEDNCHIKRVRKSVTRRLAVLDENDQPTGEIVTQRKLRTAYRWG